MQSHHAKDTEKHSSIIFLLQYPQPFYHHILLFAPTAPCPFGIFLSVPNASKSFFL